MKLFPETIYVEAYPSVWLLLLIIGALIWVIIAVVSIVSKKYEGIGYGLVFGAFVDLFIGMGLGYGAGDFDRDARIASLTEAGLEQVVLQDNRDDFVGSLDGEYVVGFLRDETGLPDGELAVYFVDAR